MRRSSAKPQTLSTDSELKLLENAHDLLSKEADAGTLDVPAELLPTKLNRSTTADSSDVELTATGECSRKVYSFQDYENVHYSQLLQRCD